MRRLIVPSVVLLVATACAMSTVDRDATVTGRGTVLDAEGKPRAGATVVLFKQPDVGDAVFGLAFVVASLGTACLVNEPPAICGKAQRTTAGDDGSYAFQLKGNDTQGSLGTAATFHLSTGLPDNGPSVSARFQVQREGLTLPALRLWAPRFELSVTRGAARADWDALDGSDSEQLIFFRDSDSEAVWAVAARGSTAVDARVLEDANGTAVVEASSNEDAPGTSVRITNRSAAKSWIGIAGAAPSRSAPCNHDPCTATDGDLGAPETGGTATPEVSIDLGRSRTIPLIAVRGCPGNCDVETSVDSQAWKVVGSGDKPFFSVTPASGPAVRFVRVRSTSDLSRLAEVSVW